jgi:hypothetical protein
VGNADEFGQGHTGFFTAQTMQINFSLNGPATFAQFLGHIDANARASKAQSVVGIEQGADIKAITQGITEHRLFVFLALNSHRRWRWQLNWRLSVQRHALHHPDGARKQVGLGFALASLGDAGSLFGLRFLMRLGQLFLDLLEVLQGVDFHLVIVPQKNWNGRTRE